MAEDEYITLAIDTDPDDLAQEALDYLQDVIPGFVAAPGNIETWLIEAIARIASEVRDVAAQVPKAIFRYYGNTVVGLPPIDDVAAVATSTWTMKDNAGYTIPAGTVVSMQGPDGELVAFEVVDDVTVSAGSTATAAGEVDLVAAEAGTAANDATGPVELIDSLEYVSSIALVVSPNGGTDAETDDEYLDRLSAELRLSTPRPILPSDFAVLARRVAGVERATAIDGYDPAGPSYDNDKMVAIAAHDEDGAAVGAGVKAEIESTLEAMREVNFVVNVIDPEFTTIDVTFTATIHDGYDPDEVITDAEEALAEFLSPLNWGLPPSGTGETREWINTDKVRYLDVATVINNVDGINAVTALTVEGGTADVTMTGAAPLPTPGTITGTAA